jgi:branched-chain amino acid transport system permease protein
MSLRTVTVRPALARPVVAAAVAVATILIAALVAMMVQSELVMTLLTQAVITAILATGVGFLIRQNGVVSFGHAAFYGIACYTIVLTLRHGIVGPGLAIILALIIPTVVAFLLGLVIVRIPGIAFSMLTLAVGQAFFEFAMKARQVTGGEDGLSINLPARIFCMPTAWFQSPHSMFVISWAVLALIVLSLWFVAESPFGRLTAAIRENEERARFIGYETTLPRVVILALSAFVVSVAGVLFTLYNVFVSPDVLHWSLSGSALIMAIIGGPQVIWGPTFGAIVYFFAKDLVGDLTEHWQAVIGLILIAVTLVLPAGVGGALAKLWPRSTASG